MYGILTRFSGTDPALIVLILYRDLAMEDLMATKLAPTKGNLVNLTRSMKMAQSGHDLLDQKRQVLMMELVRYIDAAKTIKEMSSVYSKRRTKHFRRQTSLSA